MTSPTKALLQECQAALKAQIMVRFGPKPQKLDDALSWRENDERAKEMADSALARIDAALSAPEGEAPVATVEVGPLDHGPFIFKETAYGADTLRDGKYHLYLAPTQAAEPGDPDDAATLARLADSFNGLWDEIRLTVTRLQREAARKFVAGQAVPSGFDAGWAQCHGVAVKACEEQVAHFYGGHAATGARACLTAVGALQPGEAGR